MLFPRMDRIAIGVIREEGSNDTRVDPAVNQEMMARAEKLLPEMKVSCCILCIHIYVTALDIPENGMTKYVVNFYDMMGYI